MNPRWPALIALAVMAAGAPAWAQSKKQPKDLREPDPFEEDEDTPRRSTTPEVDACKPPLTPAQRLRKVPLPTSTRNAVLAVWKWLGVQRRQLRKQAREHDKRGRALFAQGDYEGAITEWVAAYCHIPHYDVLYNVALAFERQVDYEKAVAYLHRSILESPPSATADREVLSYRVQVLSKLPARVKVATFPPRARVSLRSDTGITARGTANEDRPLLVRKGTYTLRVEQDGYIPISQKIEVKIGQPYSYYFRLQPQQGTVRITTDPSDARLFVDNRLVGLGRYVERLPIGKHEVTAERPGRDPVKRSFEVRAARETRLHLTLRPTPRSGRNQLMLAASALGGLIGLGSTRTGSSDPVTVLLGTGIGTAVGAGVAYYAVPRDITSAHAALIVTSSLAGGLQGALIAGVFFCDNVNPCNDEAISGAATVAGVTSLLAAAVFGARLDPSPGDVALINTGALWGSVAGYFFSSAMDTGNRDTRALTLVGLNLGLVAGYTLARRSEISRRRAVLIDLAGAGGIVAGIALTNVVSEDVVQERTSHFGLLGMTVGLITGTYLTRNLDEPKAVRLRSSSIRTATSSVIDAGGRATTTFGITGRF